MKTNEEIVDRIGEIITECFTRKSREWRDIKDEILGLLASKDKEKEEAVAAERERIKEIIKISTAVYQGRGATLRQIGGGEMKQILTQAINRESI